ncbi:MAG: thioester reductase domain-containing protein [Acidobacteria bacterium]|nr:thioester reductase domain-containing protein [Acidobacteriota bacterium]
MSVAISSVDVESTVAAVARRCLRSGHSFDLDTPFALLGLDSLGTIEMAAALEEAIGCELPAELVLECGNGLGLASRIAELQATTPASTVHDPFDQMFLDAVLPGDVRPVGPVAASTDLRHSRRILLTGATGFLGSALLEELLATSNAEVVCLVRGSLPPTRDRVRVIAGNLSHPHLGLEESALATMSTDIDAIVHCGAAVNWVYSYSALRAANVLGTVELLRLACRRNIPFHFISSLSVCYSSRGPGTADEHYDPLPHLRGVQLGYAQTKVIAEALVAEAARRGLATRIYRPSLISGESAGSAYNRDDLISTLIRGCVQMGSAPDLDWKLDCEPVDAVARAIVRLSADEGPVFHLGHEKPRHWRECALWMRMYGYPVRLVPYHTWLRQLGRETAPSAEGSSTHPLRPLRTFFLDRHRDSHGLTLPELYEDGRRTRAEGSMTQRLREGHDVLSPSLDATLLDCYFTAFRAKGDLPSPPLNRVGRCSAEGSLRLTPDLLTRVLNRPVSHVRLLDAGSDHSIVGELTAWRSKRPAGLFRMHVDIEDGTTIDLRLKVKAEDADVVAVGESLANLLDRELGDAYARWSHCIGFAASHHREIAIYQQSDARFTRHAPALLGSVADDHSRTWVLALENLRNATLLDSAGRPGLWTPENIATAIDGLAALQGIWHGREADLRAQPWIGSVQTAGRMGEMTELWSALARHAAPAFSAWADPEIGTLQQKLITSVRDWWSDLEAPPRTLIHNDFNPRNVCIRGRRLCAYDWELATLGAPQHDLAEFLCFVLSPGASAGEVQHWMEHHRSALERETGTAIDREQWRRGFRACVYDLMVNRLPTYALVHRVRRQAFLPRVLQTWRRLYELFPLEQG